LAGAFLLLLSVCWLLIAQSATKPEPLPPGSEKLIYDAEWRLIHAGTVTVESDSHHYAMHLESAGIVSSLYKIEDNYRAEYDESGCAASSFMDSLEGKNHRETRVTVDRSRNHASFLERDVLKNSVIREAGSEVPNCVFETLGGMRKLRTIKLEPGQSTQVSITDGRRSAAVKITAEEREEVKAAGATYHTIRYEADLLNGVIYSRKGRLLVWITDDARHLPVQIQVRMNFPIGTVTLQLEKEEHT
jgi:hypothetical protein